jgi:hypothetical protein
MLMRKLLVLTAAILSLGPQVRAQVPQRYDVLGRVKSFRQETAKLTEVDGEPTEGPRVLIQTATFDDHGNTLERIMNNPDGTLKWKVSWVGRATYDANGRETERITLNEEGVEAKRTVSLYDSDGNLNRSLTYDSGRLVFDNIFAYDQQGHKIRADHFNADKSWRSTDLFAYDSHGYLSEIRHSEGISRRDSLRNDEQGNPLEWLAYDQDGRRVMKVCWEYSDNSRQFPAAYLRYGNNDKVFSRESFIYEFDSQGNWIKSKTTREVFNGQTSIIETEITYRTIIYR